jgi:hypothetical protein
MPRYSKANQPKDYVRNKDLVLEIMQSKKINELTPKASAMLLLIVKGVSKKFYYTDPEIAKDCLQTAHLDIFANWRNFDVERSQNAFAYYTEIAKRGFARGWNDVTKKKGDPDKETVTFSYNNVYEDGGDMLM